MDYFVNMFSGALSWTDIIVRTLVSVLVGMLIGLEREISNHPAGMKTHALVCLGSAVCTMISDEMTYQLTGNTALNAFGSCDISRIAAGVVSGIGFIGAGAIIKSKDGSVVTGITTAATVWAAGCIGLAIGAGYFRMVLIVTIAILFVTFFFKKIEDRFIKTRGTRFIEIILEHKSAALQEIDNYFDLKGITVTSFDCTSADPLIDDKDAHKFCARYFLRIPKSIPFNIVMRDLSKIENVIEVYESTSASSSQRKSMHSQT